MDNLRNRQLILEEKKNSNKSEDTPLKKKNIVMELFPRNFFIPTCIKKKHLRNTYLEFFIPYISMLKFSRVNLLNKN